MKRKKAIIFLICIISVIQLCACKPAKLSESRIMLDTYCEITAYDCPQSIIDGAFELISSYEKKLSTTLESSYIYKLNRSDSAVEVDGETLSLIQRCLEYYKSTDGTVDVTLGAITSLWDFTADAPSLPDADRITVALKSTGAENCVAEQTGVLLKNGMQLDLGGIAKGYISDMVSEYLKSNGVTRAIVNLGGDITVIGSKSASKKWNIAIQNPWPHASSLTIPVYLSDISVATSGTYQRCFELNGKNYHHILNPETGYPAESDLLSATVFSESAELCDVYATACIVLGSEKASELIKKNNLSAVLIKSDGEQITVGTDYSA